MPSALPDAPHGQSDALPGPEQGTRFSAASSSSTNLPAPDEKHAYVQAMFDAIAPRYDLLNSVLSVRLHHLWRRVAVREANVKAGDAALDICTGTGDLAFALADKVERTGEVVGGDFSRAMLEVAGKKQVQHPKATAAPVTFVWADAQQLPFEDNRFAAATVGFGIRNVADVERGIREMARVVKPGGRVVLLEFNQPLNPLMASLYRWYSFHILPRIGGMISGRRAAYEYLPNSVAAFYSREELADMMRRAGLSDIKISNLTFGIVVIHRGTKS